MTPFEKAKKGGSPPASTLLVDTPNSPSFDPVGPGAFGQPSQLSHDGRSDQPPPTTQGRSTGRRAGRKGDAQQPTRGPHVPHDGGQKGDAAGQQLRLTRLTCGLGACVWGCV